MSKNIDDILNKLSSWLLKDIINIISAYAGRSLNETSCQKCGNYKLMFAYNEDGECIEKECPEYYTISTDCAEIFCRYCHVYHFYCEYCCGELITPDDRPVVLLQFIGHSIDDNTSITENIIQHDNTLEYSYENKNMYYCDIDEIPATKNGEGITGSCGGEYHRWRCSKCKKDFWYTDK
jgi:hypothetical protein